MSVASLQSYGLPSRRAVDKTWALFAQQQGQVPAPAGPRPLSPRPLPVSYERWLRQKFPTYFTDTGGTPLPFAAYHHELWQWIWALRPGTRPAPFLAVWPRGGGKSTTAELACVVMGYFGLRRYGLYICATQEQADDHVGTNVAGLFEVIGAERLVGKYGHSRGWRRNRVWTADGFAVDALGLDTAARGAKLDDTRPDFMIIDDIDQDHDTELLVMKKMRSLTRKLLPAGSGDLAVLGVQNLVHEHGIFSRLVDGRADFLTNRVVSGPYPALNHLTYAGEGKDAVLTSGEPTWEGLSLLRCQGMVQLMGLEAFLAECQHEKRTLASTMFGDVWQAQVHVLEPFPIPAPWRIDRTFDWGSSRPFAVLWWAEADGVTRTDDGRAFPRGTVFCINELYGWNGVPNQGLRLTNTQKTTLRESRSRSTLCKRRSGLARRTSVPLRGIRWSGATERPPIRRLLSRVQQNIAPVRTGTVETRLCPRRYVRGPDGGVLAPAQTETVQSSRFSVQGSFRFGFKVPRSARVPGREPRTLNQRTLNRT